MTLLSLYFMPDPILRDIAKPVDKVTSDIVTLLNDMLETMYKEEGIGLAAPQIGVSKRVIVMDIYAGKEDVPGQPLKMINPEIIAASDDLVPYEEGCLSIPAIRGDVERPSSVTVRYLDVNGQTQIVEMSGLAATCVQHEIDHLDGKLFIDYLTPLKRNMLLRKYNKRQQLKDS